MHSRGTRYLCKCGVLLMGQSWFRQCDKYVSGQLGRRSPQKKQTI
jgi:hypothetical protein